MLLAVIQQKFSRNQKFPGIVLILSGLQCVGEHFLSRLFASILIPSYLWFYTCILCKHMHSYIMHFGELVMHI